MNRNILVKIGTFHGINQYFIFFLIYARFRNSEKKTKFATL